MKRSLIPLLLAAGLALSGCAASIAAGVVGAAVRAGSPNREVGYSADLVAAAREACRARAAQHGTPHVIDAEQARRGRVTVWGTVQSATERRAFTCTWNGQVSRFTLRAISAR